MPLAKPFHTHFSRRVAASFNHALQRTHTLRHSFATHLLECLNREQLWTLTEARVVIEEFRRQYNHERPHSKLGYESPVAFAARIGPFPSAVGLRPPCAGNGQAEQNQTTSTKSPD